MSKSLLDVVLKGTARPIRFTLRKVRVNQDGYDSVGNYWGVGDPLYQAYSERGTMHVRGKSREEAKIKVKAAFPTAAFVRNV